MEDPDTGMRPRTRMHAERLANVMVGDLAKGRVNPDKEITLKELDEMYIRVFPGRLNAMSEKNRETAMRRFYEHFSVVREIDHLAIGSYVTERLRTPTRFGKKRSMANVNRELAFLRRLLNWAWDQKIIDEQPFRGFKFLPEPKCSPRILSNTEMVRLEKALEQERFAPIRLIVLTILDCGLRPREVFTLQWMDTSDFDEAANYIDLENEVFDLSVTKSTRRVVPITKRLIDEYKSYPRTSNWVHPSPHDLTRPIGSIKKSFQSLLKESGIRGFKFYNLRHTAASWMLAHGADIMMVKEILGHADIKTTQRYLSAIAEEKRNAVNWRDKQSLPKDQKK